MHVKSLKGLLASILRRPLLPASALLLTLLVVGVSVTIGDPSRSPKDVESPRQRSQHSLLNSDEQIARELAEHERLAHLGILYESRTPHVYRTPPPDTGPPDVPAAGGLISEGKNIPVRGIVAENAWSRFYQDGSRVAVWVGAQGSRTTPSQGVVVVLTEESLDGMAISSYMPVVQTGSLRITDVQENGHVIEIFLESAQDHSISFNLESRQFRDLDTGEDIVELRRP